MVLFGQQFISLVMKIVKICKLGLVFRENIGEQLNLRKFFTLTQLSPRKVTNYYPRHYSPKGTQLLGRLFSPSDISKKLSHHFLLHFPLGMGSYDHHPKYQGVFMDL